MHLDARDRCRGHRHETTRYADDDRVNFDGIDMAGSRRQRRLHIAPPPAPNETRLRLRATQRIGQTDCWRGCKNKRLADEPECSDEDPARIGVVEILVDAYQINGGSRIVRRFGGGSVTRLHSRRLATTMYKGTRECAIVGDPMPAKTSTNRGSPDPAPPWRMLR